MKIWYDGQWRVFEDYFQLQMIYAPDPIQDDWLKKQALSHQQVFRCAITKPIIDVA